MTIKGGDNNQVGATMPVRKAAPVSNVVAFKAPAKKAMASKTSSEKKPMTTQYKKAAGMEGSHVPMGNDPRFEEV